ncbi:MAG: carboxypeptidase regulatory-like domain-containing protein [Terriglobia bacterium]
MKRPIRFYFTLAVLLLWCFPFSARSQTTFGSITGVVTDPSGAAVPGAQITAVDQATGVAYHSKSATDGTYTVADLPVATYSVRAQAKGFSPQQRSGLVIYTHHVINVNFKLAVGAATTVVNVNAAPPVIDTQTGTLSNTMLGSPMEQLPVAPMIRQGIGIYAFAMYNPGVGVNDSGKFYANGTRQIDTFYSNDGIVDMQDVDGIGGAPSSIDLSTLSEMTVVTAGANAEYRSPTNVITVSKSGTNQFHGELYEDWNCNALNAGTSFLLSCRSISSTILPEALAGRSKKINCFSSRTTRAYAILTAPSLMTPLPRPPGARAISVTCRAKALR